MSLPDVATLASYGGPKINDEPVEDYLTDEDANDRNNNYADTAAMTHTACRAWVCFLGHATTPTDPTTNVHDSQWNNGNVANTKPVVAKGGTGIYTITYPASNVDELGVTKTLNLRRAWANVEGTTPYFVQAQITSPNVITVRVFNAAGTANDAAGVTLVAYAV